MGTFILEKFRFDKDSFSQKSDTSFNPIKNNVNISLVFLGA